MHMVPVRYSYVPVLHFLHFFVLLPGKRRRPYRSTTGTGAWPKSKPRGDGSAVSKARFLSGNLVLRIKPVGMQ